MYLNHCVRLSGKVFLKPLLKAFLGGGVAYYFAEMYYFVFHAWRESGVYIFALFRYLVLSKNKSQE